MVQYVHLNEDNLQPVRELVNRNLEFDKFSPEVFRYKTLGDPDFGPEMTVVAVSEGRPCGCMLGVCRQSGESVHAAIKLMAVDRESRGCGIGTEMLSRIEATAKARGVESMGVGFTRPNYFVPGLDPRYTLAAAFLLRRGYTRRGEGFNMDVDLSASDWSTAAFEEKLARDGYTCRRLRADEKDRLRDYMSADGWSEAWQYQTLHAAEADPVAVFITEKDGRIVAFACYDGVRPGWFGPMGTSESLRGSGIGGVTFLKCLQSMKEVGYAVCEINSVGPLCFYSKVANATVSRIWWQFRKNLR